MKLTEKLDGGIALDAVLPTGRLVGSAVNGSDLELALELRGRLDPCGLQVLAVAAPYQEG